MIIMGVTVGFMRQKIAAVYDTMNWRDKVAKMYDDQVIAIYYKLLKSGKLDTVQKIERPRPLTNHEKYEQLNMFELLK